MTLKVIETTKAPKAIGPYSQAIAVEPFLYTSGQIPVIPETGEIAGATIEEQTEQSLKNLKAVVEAGGAKLHSIVKTTVFLKNMNDFVKMNGVYERFFEGHKPARSTVEVARLPKDCLVEIECVAILSR
jgi:2-iminobutanoate/2-iminopropanoate deaminase